MTFGTALSMSASASASASIFDPRYTMSTSPSASTSTLATLRIVSPRLKRKFSRSCIGPPLSRRKRARSCSDVAQLAGWYGLPSVPASVLLRKSISLLRQKRVPRTACLPHQWKAGVVASLPNSRRPKAPLPRRQLKTEIGAGTDLTRALAESRLRPRLQDPSQSRQDGRVSDLGVEARHAEVKRESCPRDVVMTFDYGMTDGNIAPCFYPGATIPLVIRSTRLIPAAVEPRIRTVLLCHLDLPITGEITRMERWYDASHLSEQRQQTLGLTLPLSPCGPASHDTSNGLFGVGWTLYVELHVVEEGRRRLAAAFNRSLTILPSTPPTPPLLLDPVELQPAAEVVDKTLETDGIEITGWTPNPATMQVGLDTSSYSPNSIVPVHLDFRFPSIDSERTELGSSNDESEDEVQVEAKLVRTQQILLRAPGQPDFSRSTKHLISQRSLTASSASPTHDLTFHLTTDSGAWPYGYSAAVRLDERTCLTNLFAIELTARQGGNVGFCSIPIVVGSVAEPMNAMYILRGGLVSNENGWRVPPPSYKEAMDQPVYTPGTEWVKGVGQACLAVIQS